jgi:hypothetical protein
MALSVDFILIDTLHRLNNEILLPGVRHAVKAALYAFVSSMLPYVFLHTTLMRELGMGIHRKLKAFREAAENLTGMGSYELKLAGVMGLAVAGTVALELHEGHPPMDVAFRTARSLAIGACTGMLLIALNR